MEDNCELSALEPGELDIFVSCAEPSRIKVLGSKGWIDWHQRIQKLQQQAVLEAATNQEEITRDAIISYGKIPVIIHEAICVSIWRQNILPKILQLGPGMQHTFLLYAVLYHETVAVGLLEVVLHDEETCDAIADILVDLVDYCVEAITGLIGLVNDGYLKPPTAADGGTNTIEELLKQQKNLQFDIGIRCITIISSLAQFLDKIHVSASSRLYTSHDAPLLLAELLQLRPWEKRDSHGHHQQYIDGRWKNLQGNEHERICRAETLTWLALWRLLLNPDINKYYEVNNYRKSHLCKLVYRITDSQMDQIPVLEELKRSLGRLGAADISLGNTSKRPVILEVVPQIKANILKKIDKKMKSVAKYQLDNFFQPNDSDVMELAKMLSASYTSEVMEHLDDGGPRCSGCGESAAKKCSRCKTEWYCGRECQVKRWPKHKDLCDQFREITG